MGTDSHVISLKEEPPVAQGASGVGDVNSDMAAKVEMALSLKSYIKETDEGVYLDLSFLDTSQNTQSSDQDNPQMHEKNSLKMLHDTISKYIDTHHGNGKKLAGVQYGLLEVLMNGSLEEVMKLKKQNPDGVFLAERIEYFDMKILNVLYRGVFSYQNTTETYTGRFLPGQEIKSLTITWNEGDLGNVGKMLGEKGASSPTSFDDFFIFLWGQGIHFGIQYREIGTFFEKHKERASFSKGNILIASPKLPKNGTDDTIEYKRKTASEKSASENDGHTDMRVSTYTFPQAKKNELIFLLYLGQEGEDGFDIHGKIITHKAGNRIAVFLEDIPRSVPIGVKYDHIIDEGGQFTKVFPLTTEGNIIAVVAVDDVFISKTQGEHIILGKKIIHKSRIGGGKGSTGTSIAVMNEDTLFQQVGNIQSGYFLRGWQLDITGASPELAGEVTAQKDIRIDKSNVVGAQITSLHGNLTIDASSRIHSGTFIRAINGKVIIEGNVENTTICADEIEIREKAVNCILLGRKVSVHESYKNTIAAENTSVNFEKGESNYIILVFYTILKRLEGLKQKITDIEKEIHALEQSSKIDSSVVPRIQELKTFMKTDVFIYSKMKEAYDDYIAEFQGKYLTIHKFKDANSLGRVLVLPINFILHDRFYKKVTPKMTDSERSEKKDKEISNLLKSMQHMGEISSRGIILPLSGGRESLSIIHDVALIKLIDHGIAQSKNIINGRLDSPREILLSQEESADLMNGTPLGSKKTLIMPATIEGSDGCYLHGISQNGASFIIPKDMTHIQKDTGIAISCSLPSINQGNIAVSINSFRVMRAEEYPHYIQISGEFNSNDMGLDTKIQLFRNYLLHQKNR